MRVEPEQKWTETRLRNENDIQPKLKIEDLVGNSDDAIHSSPWNQSTESYFRKTHSLKPSYYYRIIRQNFHRSTHSTVEYFFEITVLKIFYRVQFYRFSSSSASSIFGAHCHRLYLESMKTLW